MPIVSLLLQQSQTRKKVKTKSITSLQKLATENKERVFPRAKYTWHHDANERSITAAK